MVVFARALPEPLRRAKPLQRIRQTNQPEPLGRRSSFRPVPSQPPFGRAMLGKMLEPAIVTPPIRITPGGWVCSAPQRAYTSDVPSSGGLLLRSCQELIQDTR